MGRQARQLSDSGFYHIVVRGINHQHIFEEESDYVFFLEVLGKFDNRDVPFLSPLLKRPSINN